MFKSRVVDTAGSYRSEQEVIQISFVWHRAEVCDFVQSPWHCLVWLLNIYLIHCGKRIPMRLTGRQVQTVKHRFSCLTCVWACLFVFLSFGELLVSFFFFFFSFFFFCAKVFVT